jgi:hypothetical protein
MSRGQPAIAGDQVERGEFLEDSHRIGGAENSDRAGEADIFGTRGGRGQDHCRGGVEELGAVMFADAENIEADLVGEFVSSGRCRIRSTGLSARPVAGSKIAAAKLSMPICIIPAPDIRSPIR